MGLVKTSRWKVCRREPLVSCGLYWNTQTHSLVPTGFSFTTYPWDVAVKKNPDGREGRHNNLIRKLHTYKSLQKNKTRIPATETIRKWFKAIWKYRFSGWLNTFRIQIFSSLFTVQGKRFPLLPTHGRAKSILSEEHKFWATPTDMKKPLALSQFNWFQET